MPTPRKIIHVDMDAFYASVEQRDNPALAGRPVVVARRGARSVVCAASYEARHFGVRSAMPALRAERLCPDAVFVPPDFPRYKAVSRQIREIFARHTDLIEPLSLDEAYLDVTHPKQNLGSATAIATQIRAAIRDETGLTASAGIAPNKFLAKIASDWNKPDGQFVLKPHQVDTFLASLPLTRLPGVGRVTAARLQSLGLGDCADVRKLPVEAIEQVLGRWGRRLHELAHGIDYSPVKPWRIASQISSEDTFAQDLPLMALDAEIQRLAQKTWDAWLREAQKHPGRVARTVVLKLKTADFRVLTRSITRSPMPRDAAELAEVAKALRQRVDLPADTLYRLAGVGLAGFAEKDAVFEQPDLFD
ncbi:DNA polymerase IV [Lysobacteraceae bacterium NML07-0707]|nr:DNA polymerase IV [Xanthomonadaceae bacterium NML07-0707]